ncbi:MMPL family transporter [Agromyces larvae]|uniref:MMPL family transporter n=1 Tax=Agromyces larvae TaxID=2929802 RepID=UPI0025B690BF|nr:MMPL family transporter [Agromyces larvae]
MALLLHRIGRFAFRRVWLVIGAWALALAAFLGAGVGLGGQLQESFAIPGTESQEAIDHLAAVFPQTAGAQAKAVVEAPDGASVEDPPFRDAIAAMETELEQVDGVASVLGPFDEYAGDQVSDDGRTAYLQVQFDGSVAEVTDASIEAVTATGAIADDAGMAVAFGGEVFQETSFGLTLTEVFGVVFAGVVLVITFGSLLAAGMPLLTAILGVGLAFGGISIVAAFAPVSSTAPMLAVMIGLAVGIDYALFILSRHRTQLARGQDPEDSAAEAVATAGGAVVFAGLTVIIALLGLLVVGIPFLSVMGVGAAFAVLVAVAGAVTLLPALLGVAGRRLVPKPGSRAHRRAVAHDEGGKRTMGRRWVDLVLKAPAVFLVLVVGVLGTAAIPAASLDLNLPSDATAEPGSAQREAYDLIADGFGPGYNGPLIVTVDITQTTDIFDDLDEIGDRIAALDGVAYVGQGLPNETVDTAIIQVIPESAPNDPETKRIVEEIRELEPSIAADFGTPIAVTGYTAVSIDISNRLDDALIPFALIVVGLSIVLLLIVFRSVFVPLKAALGFLLSAFGAIGLTVAVFQWGWFADLLHIEPGPILSFLPILLMAVLFGLAMDYEVFLVSGMREEYVRSLRQAQGAGAAEGAGAAQALRQAQGAEAAQALRQAQGAGAEGAPSVSKGEPRTAIVHGFQHAARVVTAAALIMFFVFFAFVPEGSGVIKGIAFALAVGVAFDAFLVRMTLVPAAMALAGRGAWWLPRWLDRALPSVDIEGEGLRDHLEQAAWAAGSTAVIRAERAVFGLADRPVGPVDVEVPAGGLLLVEGEPVDRRIVAATLAGRLEPVSGRVAVFGRPLPSEAGAVARRVAIAEVAAGDGNARTVGEQVGARLDATRAWYRLWPSRRARRVWVERAAQASGAAASDASPDAVSNASAPFAEDTPVAALGAVDRTLVALAAALAEKPDAVVIDLDDETGADDARLWAAAAALVPRQVAVIAGVAPGRPAAAFAARGIRTVRLSPVIQEAIR